MAVQNINITEKRYTKLAILASLEGLSFCCFDTLNNRVTSVNEIRFDNSDKETKIENLYANAFNEFKELNEKYDEVVVIHSNTLCTFVPEALFDENFLASYLQFNTKVFENDYFAFDEISNYQINCVYIPYANINNFFIDKFGSFDYKHANSILMNSLLNTSKNIDKIKMSVHFNKSHFEIIVIQNQKLLLFNSYQYNTPEDFIYYVLFTAEQLDMNPEHFLLELIGDIDTESDFYKMAYKYIRNVSLLDVANLRLNNYFSEAKVRNHYILFNS